MARRNLASKAVQKLEWKGREVTRLMRRAEARAAGWTMAVAIRTAKQNHPGWRTRSGRAEKSVKRYKLKREGDVLVGEWGSKLFYVLFLELEHGSFLRKAADEVYPRFPGKIAEFFEEMR